MRASRLIAGSLFAASPSAATSAPDSKPTERVVITDFTVRQEWSFRGTRIRAVDFRLTGRNARGISCTVRDPEFPKPREAASCRDSKYRFMLYEGTRIDEFRLHIYHEMGLAVGLQGIGSVPTCCRDGGNGPNDYLCLQTLPTNAIDIDSTPINP
ncbi:hypothetical protein XA68_17640 [Ophiocordyceps unilateralis]|uniref:AA1-like domain-containing protein n=1 Tax=Ophiocordyceps unilateralis TaxID=268505 RepID=A0A2A9P2R7_OPHUN|nr:hypothetical protein XA68_17640 [Ophiocordyceps unilateralis]